MLKKAVCLKLFTAIGLFALLLFGFNATRLNAFKDPLEDFQPFITKSKEQAQEELITEIESLPVYNNAHNWTLDDVFLSSDLFSSEMESALESIISKLNYSSLDSTYADFLIAHDWNALYSKLIVGDYFDSSSLDIFKNRINQLRPLIEQGTLLFTPDSDISSYYSNFSKNYNSNLNFIVQVLIKLLYSSSEIDSVEDYNFCYNTIVESILLTWNEIPSSQQTPHLVINSDNKTLSWSYSPVITYNLLHKAVLRIFVNYENGFYSSSAVDLRSQTQGAEEWTSLTDLNSFICSFWLVLTNETPYSSLNIDFENSLILSTFKQKQDINIEILDKKQIYENAFLLGQNSMRGEIEQSYEKGYNDCLDDFSSEDLYEKGYLVGKEQGARDAISTLNPQNWENFNLGNIFGVGITSVTLALKNMLGFDLFGINVFGLFCFSLTLGLFIWFIKKVK